MLHSQIIWNQLRKSSVYIPLYSGQFGSEWTDTGEYVAELS